MRQALLSGSGSVPSQVLLLLHVSSLPGWSSWLKAVPPALSTLHPLLTQQELYTQLSWGLGVACEQTSLHFQSMEATGTEGRRGPTQGAAFAEPQVRWPGSRWDWGRPALPRHVCDHSSCLCLVCQGHGARLLRLMCPLLFYSDW